MDKAGKLGVFGGAVALNHKVTAHEPTVAQKSELNKEEKKKVIAGTLALSFTACGGSSSGARKNLLVTSK